MSTNNLRVFSLPALSLCFLFSCNPASQPEHSHELPPTPPAPETAVNKFCYAHDSDTDLIGLTLEVRGDQFSGKIAYALEGFDRTAGQVEGYIHGDTLIGLYTYVFAGKSNVREIIFLNQDNILVEAQDDQVERDGRKVYRNRSALKFPGNFPMHQVPCVKPAQ